MFDKFKIAGERDAYLTGPNGEQILLTNYKVIVNENDVNEQFSVVSRTYKIAQHKEVGEIIEKALNDLNTEYKLDAFEVGNTEKKQGHRMRADIKFPTISHSIAGEKIILWATFDNSYDQSTGLRLEVNAYMPNTDTSVYCGSEFVCEGIEKFYHRHTKGLEVGMLEGTISKGIKEFQKKVGEEFTELANTPCTGDQAKRFIDNLISLKGSENEKESKKVKIAMKYLESIKTALGDGSSIHNAWNLYSLISKVLGKEVESVDLRRGNARELLNKIKTAHFGVMVNNKNETSEVTTTALMVI